MNESIVIEVDGDRRTITVTDAGKVTAADMNCAIAEAFPGGWASDHGRGGAAPRAGVIGR